jgi:hypothetical protein
MPKKSRASSIASALASAASPATPALRASQASTTAATATLADSNAQAPAAATVAYDVDCMRKFSSYDREPFVTMHAYVFFSFFC